MNTILAIFGLSGGEEIVLVLVAIAFSIYMLKRQRVQKSGLVVEEQIIGSNSPRRPRPTLVFIATVLGALPFALGVLNIGPGAKPTAYIVYAIASTIVFLPWLLTYFGKNWARWLCAVLVVGGLLLSPLTLPRTIQKRPDFSVTVYWSQGFLHLAAIALLFLKPSNEWFKPKSALPPPLAVSN